MRKILILCILIGLYGLLSAQVNKSNNIDANNKKTTIILNNNELNGLNFILIKKQDLKNIIPLRIEIDGKAIWWKQVNAFSNALPQRTIEILMDDEGMWLNLKSVNISNQISIDIMPVENKIKQTEITVEGISTNNFAQKQNSQRKNIKIVKLKSS